MNFKLLNLSFIPREWRIDSFRFVSLDYYSSIVQGQTYNRWN